MDKPCGQGGLEMFCMTYDELIAGLKLRGFVGTDKICNKGGCHNEFNCHFILLTDGLVIYSNTWNWNDKHNPNSKYELWPLETHKSDPHKPFEFHYLDNIMGKS